MAAEPTDRREIHPAFASALRADRESLNGRFAARQRAGARIDEAAFQAHLRTTVDDLAREVASVQPERVRAVAGSLFDVSLDLFAAGLLGPEIKHPHVRAAWREVLPRAARLLARDPGRVAGSLSNAVDYLAAQPGSRPAEWIQLMRDLSPHCDSVQQWLDVGKIAAWKAGLVQFRSAALGLARQLPLKLAARSIGVLDDVSEQSWHQRLDRLEADRWMAPSAAETAGQSRSLRIVCTTGGFRGFGGPCLRPPTASANDGELFVSDGSSAWQLLADVFGTLWHRVPRLPAQTATPAGPSKCIVDLQGRVDWDGGQCQFAELAESSSFACDGQTLAVTVPTSHYVFLVARTAEQPG
jgi:hypothetical protein